MLQACLDKTALQVEKFSRWLRAICITLLARNRPADRLKALAYVEQAIEVIRDSDLDGEDQSQAAQVRFA